MSNVETNANICEACVPAAPKKEWWAQIVPSPRWVRIKVGDEWIADSKNVLLINEAGRLPVYYFPVEDVRLDLLKESDYHNNIENKGEVTYWDIVTDKRVIEKGAWGYLNPEPGIAQLKGHIAFNWGELDHKYEEAEELLGNHPRDPYTRIETIQSSRHVEVYLNGKLVADSVRPVLLLETGLAPRYYLPKEDIKTEYFSPAEGKSTCPYKGIASYWSADIDGQHYDKVVWSYQDPVPELPKIKGLYSFFNENEHIELVVDGEKWELQPQERLPYGKKYWQSVLGESNLPN